MDNNSVNHTYVLAFTMQHDTLPVKGGICFSCLSLNALKAYHQSFLHPHEHAYFNTLHYPKRRYNYLLGRFCAKQALSGYDKRIDPTAIEITHGVFQQPIVYSTIGNNLQVSISHTTSLGAALAFPEAHPMAIDVETIDPSKRETILSQLTPHELKLLHSLDMPLQALWTIKEALSKVLKCGLTVPFEVLEVESLTQHENYFIISFKHFAQYQAVSFLLPQTACSIVYPQKTQLELNIAQIQESIHHFKLSPIAP